MNVVYLILHYLAGDDTIECIDSILNATANSEHNTHIVVVDNGSTNNSYSKIQEKFKTNDSVTLLHSDKNLGFARGNNIGFNYAKNNLHADFIVQLNNDTILEQCDFNEALVKKFDEKKYFVLGPDIESADGYHQNPGHKQSWSFRELFCFRLKKRVQIVLSLFGFKQFGEKAAKYSGHIEKTLVGDVENTILHGACLIFSPLYIRRFDGLCEKTFLYWEEDILKLSADYYGFLMLYSSDLHILHKEDAATNMVSGSSAKKTRKKLSFLIASSKIYSNLKIHMLLKKKIISAVEQIAGNAKTDKYKIDLDTPISYILGLSFERAIMLIRGKIRFFGGNHGKKLFIGKKVTLKCKSKLHIGKSVSIQDNVYIDALSLQGVHLNNGCSLGKNSVIRCSGNMQQLGVGFFLGMNSSLADNCFIGATGGVFIGNDVIGGQNIRFHSSNHKFNSTDILIRKQGVSAKGIRIGNNCWLGAGAVFCDGSSIGNGCVVAANSVVTKKFPDNCIVAGVPAKIIKYRNASKA